MRTKSTTPYKGVRFVRVRCEILGLPAGGGNYHLMASAILLEGKSMDWLTRYLRRARKQKRRVTARNVRAYRKRQRQAGMKRLDVALPAPQHAAVLRLMLPGETISQVVGRLLAPVTGSIESA